MTKEVILVVDDNATIRQLLNLLLTRVDYSCLTANNGLAGINLARHRPDVKLIISDIDMPEMGGLEMVQQIRQLTPSSPPIPVIFVSGRDRSREVANIPNAKFVGKPFRRSIILDSINFLLTQSR